MSGATTVYPLDYPSTYGAAFPGSPLDLRAELDLGTWTDISSYVYQRSGDSPPVTITRGRPDEASQATASSATLELNNRDGRFTPLLPTSPYYGLLGRNTPLRLSVPAQTSYLRFETDAASSVSAPYTASFNIPGDLDIQVDAHLAYALTGQAIPLLAMWNGGSGEYTFYTEVTPEGTVNFWRSLDGTTTAVVPSTLPIPVGRVAIRITYAHASGIVTWYTAPTIAGPWTQLGSTQQFAAAGALYASTSSLTFGTSGDPGLTGSVYAINLLSGIGGTPVASPDFTTATAGAASVTDAQGNVWTLNGTAEISDRNYRYHGEMSSIPPKWDVTGSDIAVPVQSGGLLRRLGQGDAPEYSPIKRALLAQSGTLQVVQYWPCEDLAGATMIGSATGGPEMSVTGGTGDGSVTTTGPAFAADTSFLCSNALPTMNGSSWYGQVPRYSSNGAVVVRFLFKLGSTDPANGATIVRVITSGTVQELAFLYYTGGGLGLIGKNAAGGTVFSSGPFTPTVPMTGGLWMSMELTPDGSGTVSYDLVFLAANGGEAYSITPGTFSGTIGNVQAVYGSPAGSLTDSVLGHISVQSSWESLYTLQQPLDAWVGETAANRFARLCTENGLQARIIGAPDTSAAMGAQPVDTLLDILQECETADNGQIFEPRQCLGLGYRTLASMCTQTPAVQLDYSLSQPGGVNGDGTDSGLEPTYDDQYTRNDLIVQRGSGNVSGATFQYQLNDGSAMSISPPPVGVGDYSNSVTVNVQYDSQLPDEAGWMVHIGTVDEARWPQIPLNLARSEITATLYWALLDADIGDYAQIENLLAQISYDPVNQLVWEVTEALGGFHYTLTWCGVPESPYEVAIIGDAVYGRADTDGASLAAAVSATATTLSVATTGPSGILWTTAAADFPFDVNIGGEQITVTNITGSSSPQTFTVTRSVNGVVKAQAADADVRLWTPSILAML
jgi:hypothetical protein